ncbi:MAG: DUF1080 domain-containing protein [Armatimonadota bacterium]
MMKRSAIWWTATAALAVGVISAAAARPGYLQAFQAHYQTEGKPLAAGRCATCHVGMPNEKKWNVYGTALGRALGGPNVQDREKIIAAFRQIEDQRNPATNRTFGEMLRDNQLPGSNPGAGVSGDVANALQRPAWKPLFNGRDMSGWTKMNAGDWKVENGLLKYTGGGNGWLRSNDQYKNYGLVMVWRYTNAGNNDAGFFLRAGTEGNPWPNGGVQLNMGPGDNLGSIGGQAVARSRADLIKPAGSGQWNTYAITVMNGQATLAINGTPAWDGAANIPDNQGYIGIQNENFPLEIAQVWIAPIP